MPRIKIASGTLTLLWRRDVKRGFALTGLVTSTQAATDLKIERSFDPFDFAQGKAFAQDDERKEYVDLIAEKTRSLDRRVSSMRCERV